VKVKTGLRGLRVTGKGLVCEDKAGNEVLIEADTIILAVGQSPNRAAADALCDAAPEVMEIGDCSGVGMVTQANARAYFAALDI